MNTKLCRNPGPCTPLVPPHYAYHFRLINGDFHNRSREPSLFENVGKGMMIVNTMGPCVHQRSRRPFTFVFFSFDSSLGFWKLFGKSSEKLLSNNEWRERRN